MIPKVHLRKLALIDNKKNRKLDAKKAVDEADSYLRLKELSSAVVTTELAIAMVFKEKNEIEEIAL